MALFTKTPKHTAEEALSEDAKLVSEAVDGNPDAFGALVEKYSSFVYRTVYFDLRSKEDAEDISQEVFIKAYKALASFRYDSEFSTWLFRICKNTVYDHIRKESRLKTVSVSDMGTSDDGENRREYDIPDTEGRYEPEKTYISKETAELVHEAISTLSEEHRDIIVMRDIEGMSYSQIADILSLEEGTVKSRLSRARTALKKKLLSKGMI